MLIRLCIEICCLDDVILLNLNLESSTRASHGQWGLERWGLGCDHVLHFTEKNDSTLVTIVKKVHIQCNMTWFFSWAMKDRRCCNVQGEFQKKNGQRLLAHVTVVCAIQHNRILNPELLTI